MADAPVAAVDIGTNSVRLLVARRGQDGGLEPLVRESRITRLGQGVDATGRLAPEAVERTIDVLEGYARRWDAVGVGAVRVTATSAARDAENAAEFASRVEAVAGRAPEVISGEEEAALAFAGAVTAVAESHAAPFLVVDVGGGSTELIRGTTDVEASTSRQMGAVRLTERFLGADPPTPAQVAAAVAHIDEELDEAERLVDPASARTLVGVAGTVTTVAAVAAALPRFDVDRVHRTTLSAGELEEVTRRLCGLAVAERAAIPAMPPGREDVIAAGALIIDRVVQRFGFSELVVSSADILDGIALSVLWP